MQWWILTIWLLCINNSSPVQALDLLDEEISYGVPTLLLDNLQLTLSSQLLVDIFSPTVKTLKGYLGWLPKTSNTTYTSCSENESQSGAICLKYKKEMKLIVMQDNSDHCEKDSLTCHTISCHKIHWFNHRGGSMDCFLLGDDLWYGGSSTISQRWPLQSDSRPWYPAATGDPLHHPSGNVLENLWISSSGFAIFVDHNTSLYVNFNESGNGKLCFTTSAKKHPYQNRELKTNDLAYSICAASSIKEAHTFSLHKWIKKPSNIPNEKLFQHPIWSTWAKYKQNIDQNIVLNFASDIFQSGFEASQLEIDDKWENCYGNLEFDQEKFPDPARMTEELKSFGLYTTLWVHPFCNKNCVTYNIGKTKGYWVKNKEGNVLDVKWWNGLGAVLDVTNEEAAEWFKERLQMIQINFGIESFKFDAGEILWLDTDFYFHNSEANAQPNIYSQLYAEIAAEFGRNVEVRTGYKTQHLPILVRMFDKYSVWNYANGLQTLIPNTLNLSMLGYYFVLPDMVGGNNYNSLDGSLPERELYVRWLEANIFLPFIQFSIPPWDYDDEIVQISKKMLSLREQYIGDIMRIAHKATLNGEPIIRPLWWITPDDSEAYKIDSEFLVGDEILIAPVLHKGTNQRHIYLPGGKWKDAQRGKIYEGSEWLYNYNAPLNFLPVFIRYAGI
ncbi:myogenesis-regulating glycosidase [Parasteatoda tepidariorum]|uniref:myogenesis-regulating glycosidase n=1 Tax=Parasteatoda tepidariorum TaxID=114398 RepID=UPI00077FB975|nr:myogenesis-regulating glycosidase-like [Parasteatoda tepidariorum]